MRFVVLSDIHLHEWSYGSRIINGRNSRLEQQVDIIRSIAEYCRDAGITEAVSTGDIFHSSTVTAAVSEAAYRGFSRFKEYGINLTVVPGNHDQSTRTGEVDALAWFSAIGRLASGVQATDFKIHGQPAVALPYTHDKSLLAQRLDGIDGRTRLLFMHQGVGGVEINSKGFTLNEALTPEMVPPFIAFAATGHYHSAKRVTPNLIIPGSMNQLNWGDKGEFRGWLDVEYDPQTNEVNVLHLESKASKFVLIDRPDEEAAIEGNFIRLVTADSTPSYTQDAIEHLLALGAASVEVKNVVQSDSFVSNVQVKTFSSLNEIIWAFAKEKERLGDIDEHAVFVGDQLLRGNYQVPNV